MVITIHLTKVAKHTNDQPTSVISFGVYDENTYYFIYCHSMIISPEASGEVTYALYDEKERTVGWVRSTDILDMYDMDNVDIYTCVPIASVVLRVRP